jgi:hypothetical protein
VLAAQIQHQQMVGKDPILCFQPSPQRVAALVEKQALLDTMVEAAVVALMETQQVLPVVLETDQLLRHHKEITEDLDITDFLLMAWVAAAVLAQ